MSDAYIIKRGGSGGDGHYAVISISYDVDESVIVEHNGETYEAPDTSGIWLFGCEENGDYVCKLDNESYPISETITITEQGQIERVNLYIQVAINYKLLYYLGDEFTDITGGWTAVNTGTTTNTISYYQTNNNINIDNYPYAFMFGWSRAEFRLNNAEAGAQVRTTNLLYYTNNYYIQQSHGTAPVGGPNYYSSYNRGVNINEI